MHRLVDGDWVLVPGTARPLTSIQLTQAECVGGALRTGLPEVAGPTWSPATGWTEAAPYRQDLGLTVAPEPVAGGQGNQRFVLESDGLLRRVFAAPGAPLYVETVGVPADDFMRVRTGPSQSLYSDLSPTVLAGCVSLSDPRTARCYVSSI